MVGNLQNVFMEHDLYLKGYSKIRTLFYISLDTVGGGGGGGPYRFILHQFTLWFECKQRIPVSRLIQKSVRILHPGDNLQNGATLMQRRRYGA